MRVLLLGARLGALTALRDCAELHVLSAKEPAPTARKFLSAYELVQLNSEREVLAAGRRLFAEDVPDTILACTESSVLAAAWLRDSWGIAGHGADVAERCMDKALMKSAIRSAGLACADSHLIEVGDDALGLRERLGPTVVVKEPRSSGSRGLRITRTLDQLSEALRPGLLAETFIEGTEMSVEGFVHEGRLLFHNLTNYYLPAHANILPAAIDAGAQEQIRELLEASIRALQVDRGMVHMEFFLTKSGPVFGELAARPPGGRIMRLLKLAWGFCPWRAALELELGRIFDFPAEPRCAAGTWILHPGAGRVVSIQGLEEARELPGVKTIVCRSKPGDVLGPRIGTGQDIGYIDVVGEDAGQVASRLDHAYRTLRIGLDGL